jgi:hypothetical protein
MTPEDILKKYIIFDRKEDLWVGEVLSAMEEYAKLYSNDKIKKLNTFTITRIKYNYRHSLWWKIVHYNYFHRRLFKEYYTQKKRKWSPKQIRKYKLFIKIDNIITLRRIKWLNVFIFMLER